jgi:hypothetical protein
MWLVFGACGRGFFLPKPASRLGSVTVGVPKVAAGESPAGLEEWPPPVAAVEGLPPAADAQGNLGPTFEFAPESPRSAEEPPSASDRSKGPCPREDSDGSSPAHDSATAQRPAGRPAVGDWFRVYHLNAEAVVVEALGERIDERAAAALGALCRELLPSPRRRVPFDFSGALELATVALGILVRFRNSAVYLDKRVHLIVARPLRAELEEAHVDRILDLQDSLYPFLAPRVRLVDEYGPRSPEPGGGKSGRTRPQPATLAGRMWAALARTGAALAGWARRCFGRGGLPAILLPASLLLATLLAALSSAVRAEADHPDAFPTLAELEAMLEDALDLERLRVELEQLAVRRHWTTRVTLRANYSQHFSSFVPFVPTPDLAVSGGTFVGVSVSASAAELLGRPTPDDLDAVRKRLELRALHARKLADLRQLYHQRRKHLLRLEALEAERRTAELKWERVRLGLGLMERLDPPPVAFDPIDRAEALQRLEQIDTERRRVEVDVAAVEAEMLGILGRRDFAP